MERSNRVGNNWEYIVYFLCKCLSYLTQLLEGGDEVVVTDNSQSTEHVYSLGRESQRFPSTTTTMSPFYAHLPSSYHKQHTNPVNVPGGMGGEMDAAPVCGAT